MFVLYFIYMSVVSKSTRYFRCSSKLLDDFSKIYPDCLSMFVERAIFCAVQDKGFFEQVFLSPKIVELKQLYANKE